ncbi:MAG TPA: ferritin-like protein [Chloroflexia bacterium]|nr:ferritin-like protein [Chloroflexia bacterium]
MADPTTNWTLESLHTHLQDAIDLELWTLPLYICAWTSLTERDSPEGNLILSVIMQEMLHLELASNLALAFGLQPQFNQPVYSAEAGIPFHTPDTEPPINGPYTVQLGPLNENALNLFLEIELPKDLSADKGQGTKDPADTYDSIGEFYVALQSGVNQLWNTYYQPDSVNLQKSDFSDYPDVPAGVPRSIQTLDDANQAIATIVDQGEGADSKGGNVPTEFQPNDDPDDEYSHYERFLELKTLLPEIFTYTDDGNPATDEQAALNQAFTKLLQDLTESFKTPNPPNQESGIVGDSFTQMNNIPDLATAVWQAGACPEFCVVPLPPSSPQ